MSELLRKHIEIYNERLREGKLKNMIEFKEFDAQGMQVRFRISTACNANDDDRRPLCDVPGAFYFFCDAWDVFRFTLIIII